MTRRKVDQDEQLTRKIGLRVSDPFYKKMEGWLEHSNCQSVAELARSILYKEQIIWYQKDASLDSTAAELAGIKKELKAIGTNINQVTRYFNGTDVPNQKIFQALKILDDYKRVGHKVDDLLTVIADLTKRWSLK
jgi:hypothetical protein